MSDEKWVTLTPEQVEALDQGVIVRAHRGDTMVQGPLDSVSSDGACVGIGSHPWSRFYVDGPVEVREADVPKPDPQRLVSVRPDGLTEPFVLRMAAVDIETMPLGWGGLPRSLPGTLRTLADAIDEHRAALRGETR